MRRPSTPRRPQLPPFCRRAQQRHTLVSITNLRHLHQLLWLVLIFQVSTVLLVTAGPVPSHPQPVEPSRSAGLRGRS